MFKRENRLVMCAQPIDISKMPTNPGFEIGCYEHDGDGQWHWTREL